MVSISKSTSPSRSETLLGWSRWLFSREGALRDRMVRGGIWLLVSNLSSRSAGLLKVVLLGRLLAPRDFGLMGIATMVVSWIEDFTETGFKSALVQRKQAGRDHLDTAWTVQTIRGVLLAALIWLGAPLASWFFESPEAASVVRAVSVIVVFRGLTNPAVVHFQRELDFRSQTVWRWIGVGSGVAAAIPLAFVFRNVWALVISVLVAQAAELLASYWLVPYRPRFRLNRSHVRDLMKFGKWIFWFNVVNFIALQGAAVAVGKMVGVTALGFYKVAAQFAYLPTSGFGNIAHAVLFPAFSRVEGLEPLRGMFLRTLAVTGALIVPIACFLTFFMDPLVALLLGDRWIPLVPLVRVLAWAGVGLGFLAVPQALFKGMGRPELAVHTAILRVLCLVAFLYPLVSRFDTIGAALSVLIAAHAALAYAMVRAVILLGIGRRKLAGTLKMALAGSIPFVGVGVFVPALSVPMAGLLGALAVGVFLSILGMGLRAELGDWAASSPIERAETAALDLARDG